MPELKQSPKPKYGCPPLAFVATLFACVLGAAAYYLLTGGF